MITFKFCKVVWCLKSGLYYYYYYSQEAVSYPKFTSTRGFKRKIALQNGNGLRYCDW